MDREAIEDVIVTKLKEALPAVFDVAPLPLGKQNERLKNIRNAAAWVVYLGGKFEKNKTSPGVMQPVGLSWSIMILAKDYRSPERGQAEALGALGLAQDALAGTEPDGCGPLEIVSDSVLSFAESGLIGYETVVQTTTYLRRIN